jgi:serine/threonine protein kinase/Tol biopolymer transport system component
VIGRTVLRYKIVEKLGGGGMGVVYKAEDLVLRRAVALKFLPPYLTQNDEMKERFMQEALAASALDHPNLCTVYEMGESEDGRLFIAMAYYQGETLAARLTRGALPLADVLAIAEQAASGLAAAHRRGIVHRDIKPANLIVTGEGLVKILDFGLAKLMGGMDLTRTGTSMGTPAYKSPEQTRGETVDQRTDIWSLGVVLYEMATGVRPFRGEYEHALAYSILNEDPRPPSELRSAVPADFDSIVERCLAKRPQQRYQSLDELHEALAVLPPPAEGSSGELASSWRSHRRTPVPAPRRARGRTEVALRILLVAVAGAAVAWLALRWSRPAAPPPAPTFSQLTFGSAVEQQPSLSPDGAFVAYVSEESGNQDVYLLRIGGRNAINLTAGSPADDSQPAFSPDGQTIAFRSERDGGGIFLMGATGESVRRLTRFGFNPTWSPEGQAIAFATKPVRVHPLDRSGQSQLWVAKVAGGEPRLVLASDAVQPHWSPHGARIAYWALAATAASGRRDLWTVRPDGGDPVPATADAAIDWNPVWSPDGRSLYFASDRGGSMNLWRLPIDEQRGRALGPPQPLTTPSRWSGQATVSKDGRRLAFTALDRGWNLERVAIDPRAGKAAGSPLPVSHTSMVMAYAEPSPDGRWVVVQGLEPHEDLYLIRSDGSDFRKLTDDVFNDRGPSWSPDGETIAFYSDRTGRYELWTVRVDGSGLAQVTATTGTPVGFPKWSPDGRLLAASNPEVCVLFDLAGALPLAGGRTLPAPAPGETFIAWSWSPDGTRLAGGRVHPDGSPVPGVVVFSLARSTFEVLTDSGGFFQGQPLALPTWLSDSRRLLYGDGGDLLLLDTATRRKTLLLAAPADSAYLTFHAVDGDRTVYLGRSFSEADVWLAVLEPEG